MRDHLLSFESLKIDNRSLSDQEAEVETAFSEKIRVGHFFWATPEKSIPKIE